MKNPTPPEAMKIAQLYLTLDTEKQQLPVYERNDNRQEARDCRRRIAAAQAELDAAVAAVAAR